MSDYFDRVERQIVRRVEEGGPRSSWAAIASRHLATAAAVLVVIVVAGVFLLVRGGGGAKPPAADQPEVRVVLNAAPDAAPGAIARAAQILTVRLHAAVPQAHLSTADGRIVVTATKASAGARRRILALAAPGRLAFYDWEGDAVAPNGKTVASQLPSPDSSVLGISQGNGPAAPGQLSSGCMPLQQALALADRLGAGRARRTEHIGRLKLRVPAGYTVLEAAGPQPGTPTDGYFLLRNVPVITESMIVDPRQSTDPSGNQVVQFNFSPSGQRAFEAVTATVARRGAAVSSTGQTLNQHFAIAVDNQLITVPFIDYKQYPDGITGSQGADIAGSFSTQSAKDLAILLHYGPLPVNLTATG
jgi:SecDF, P1 head subdomain